MLSSEEISLAVEKLKLRYKEYSTKYPTIFDYIGFIKRYKNIISIDGNIEQFINNEIRLFESIVNKIETRTVEKKEGAELNERVDKIIDENELKISQYGKIEFHKNANYEIMHLYSILETLYNNEWQFISKTFYNSRDVNIKSEFFNLDRKFEFFARRTSQGYSSRIESYITKLNTVDKHGVPNEEETILKEAGFLLNGISDFLADVISANKINEPDTSVSFKTTLGRIGNKRGKTVGYIMEVFKHIVEDFRLVSFKQQ